jgi:hypothetical protein
MDEDINQSVIICYSLQHTTTSDVVSLQLSNSVLFSSVYYDIKCCLSTTFGLTDDPSSWGVHGNDIGQCLESTTLSHYDSTTILPRISE